MIGHSISADGSADALKARMKSFNQWVTSIAESGLELLGTARGRRNGDVASLCRELTTSKGEALGTAIAHRVTGAYAALSDEDKVAFFTMLAREYGPDPDEIIRQAEAYRDAPGTDTYCALVEAIDSPRKSLFRGINMAPDGTATLVRMRQDLFALFRGQVGFNAIDADLEGLLSSWFNRGFLTLQEISWQTPAHVLEKLIAYEAVHEMSGWDDLRRRLDSDRRCFAFFHPALADEPLIFVEVALVKGIAGNVQELLNGEADPEAASDPDTAVFYSISNCQQGLRGISFGNFLIKQVVSELRREFENLNQFVTLSPIPGFGAWLKGELEADDSESLSEDERAHLSALNWQEAPADELKPLLMRLCAGYLAQAKRGVLPMDAVARFHLGNGAQIERLNWLGDSSAKGLTQSAGMLVNYAYLYKNLERNHEAYVNDGEVVMSGEFRKLLK